MHARTLAKKKSKTPSLLGLIIFFCLYGSACKANPISDTELWELQWRLLYEGAPIYSAKETNLKTTLETLRVVEQNPSLTLADLPASLEKLRLSQKDQILIEKKQLEDLKRRILDLEKKERKAENEHDKFIKHFAKQIDLQLSNAITNKTLSFLLWGIGFVIAAGASIYFGCKKMIDNLVAQTFEVNEKAFKKKVALTIEEELLPKLNAHAEQLISQKARNFNEEAYLKLGTVNSQLSFLVWGVIEHDKLPKDIEELCFKVLTHLVEDGRNIIKNIGDQHRKTKNQFYANNLYYLAAAYEKYPDKVKIELVDAMLEEAAGAIEKEDKKTPSWAQRWECVLRAKYIFNKSSDSYIKAQIDKLDEHLNNQEMQDIRTDYPDIWP